MLVFSEETSPRLEYILKFIFNKLLGSNFQITTSTSQFYNFDGIKLSYTQTKPEKGLWIKPSGLLQENNIHEIELHISETNWGKVLFSKPDNTLIPFDIFSACFFILSRYEEYIPFEEDKYSRFPHYASVLYKENLLSEPIINIWVNKLKETILNKYPDFKSQAPAFQFISTIDIDNAFAYKGKGFIRNAGGYSKALFSGKMELAKERIKVIQGKLTDPYDTYNYIKEVHEKYKIEPKIFILNGNYGKYDKNLKANNPKFKEKLELLNKSSEFGIHPSFASNFNNSIKKEKENLEKSVQKTITISRQHFLILHFPETYRKLIENEIQQDYSMGYSEISGYRAGTCTPFYFFDLTTNSETELLILPFVWMDRTLRQFTALTPEEAKTFITKNIDQLKKLGGTFVSLWHNESLGDTGYWKGWKEVFEFTLKKAATN